ncbi:HIT zinc finger [Striga asiatica]|uniref:HIT zinc finger n=1 Tax=Striga asiatica TaxID=4170 RepID=A0A5A7RCR0_STRAF|nr:HIT zinc finger [Striga asiatica]
MHPKHSGLRPSGGPGVCFVSSGKDDNWPVKCCPKPRNVGVPKQGSSLSRNREVVRVALAHLNRALRYISGPVGPSASKLPTRARAKVTKLRGRTTGQQDLVLRSLLVKFEPSDLYTLTRVCFDLTTQIEV